jgi:hypothetical protein
MVTVPPALAVCNQAMLLSHRKHQQTDKEDHHAERTALRLGLRGHRVCLRDGSAGLRAAIDKRALFTFT